MNNYSWQMLKQLALYLLVLHRSVFQNRPDRGRTIHLKKVLKVFKKVKKYLGQINGNNIQPWWLSGLEHVSNSIRHLLKPGFNPCLGHFFIGTNIVVIGLTVT